MNPEWLCFVNGQEYGPYTWPQLVQMAAAGNVVPSTHVRRNFDSQWYLAEHVPNLFAAVTPPTAAHPPAVHATVTPRALPAAGSGAMKAIPAGRPVVKAASAVQPAAVQPVAPQPVVQQPVPQGVPRGRVVGAAAQPPVAATNTWAPAVNTGAAPVMVSAKSPTADDQELVGKKPDSSKTMVLALGGTIIAVAILGVIAVIWKMNLPPAPAPVAAKPVEIAPEESDPALAAERDPSAANPVDPAKPTTKVVTTNANKKNDKAVEPANAGPSQAASAALVKSVTKWSPIEKFKAIGIKEGLVVDKVSVWLAVDASGKRAELIGPAAAAPVPTAPAPVAANTAPVPGETPEIIAPAITGQTLGDLVPGGIKSATSPAAEPAKFVFVELQIKNTGSKPRQYAGWNTEANSAVLVDDDGHPLPLAPLSTTPAALRKSAAELKPGETTPDTLVFAMNEPTDAEFKLVLPQRALSGVSKGNWGIAISPASLAAATPATTAQNPGGAGPSATRSSTSIPIPGLQDEPQPMPPPAVVPPVAAPGITPEPEMKKAPVPDSSGKIPIPGLTDEPAKPEMPKKPEEVPNLAPPKKN